ncbi:hypothetical protein WJX82_001515 [Trebouxia sp. C0006]
MAKKPVRRQLLGQAFCDAPLSRSQGRWRLFPCAHARQHSPHAVGAHQLASTSRAKLSPQCRTGTQSLESLTHLDKTHPGNGCRCFASMQLTTLTGMFNEGRCLGYIARDCLCVEATGCVRGHSAQRTSLCTGSGEECPEQLLKKDNFAMTFLIYGSFQHCDKSLVDHATNALCTSIGEESQEQLKADYSAVSSTSDVWLLFALSAKMRLWFLWEFGRMMSFTCIICPSSRRNQSLILRLRQQAAIPPG